MGEKVVVFGSFVVDLTSRQKGFPIPGQTLLGSCFSMGAGGKGSNQAVAAYRAGANVTFVTKIGCDVFGDIAVDFYRSEGMSTEFLLRDPTSQTGTALILVDENSAQNEIVVVSGACGKFTPGDVQLCTPLIQEASFLLVQLEINFDALYQVIEIAHQAKKTVVLNPAPAADLPDHLLRMIDIITPNESEAQVLTGIAIHDKKDVLRASKVLQSRGVNKVVITLGERGVFATDGCKSEFIEGLKVNAVDTTGAGDAFSGGFVTALSEGYDLFKALRYGNVAGALAVTKFGTAPSMPKRSEIELLMGKHYFRI